MRSTSTDPETAKAAQRTDAQPAQPAYTTAEGIKLKARFTQADVQTQATATLQAGIPP